MDIPVNAPVDCADGSCGRSTTLIVDPITQTVTHVVVQGNDEVKRLVPLKQVADANAQRILLRSTKAELANMEEFTETRFIESNLAYPTAYESVYLQPYVAPVEPMDMPIEEEKIPPGEIAIYRSMPVEATDGHVGKVGELVIEPATGKITHVVLLEGHLWGKKMVTVPLSAIDRVSGETVYLKLDKRAVESLPAVPVKR